MKKVSINNRINLIKVSIQSEFVVIDIERNGGNRASSFNIAHEGGFLTHIGEGLYKCKRIVASNLSLVIMADAEQKIK